MSTFRLWETVEVYSVPSLSPLLAKQGQFPSLFLSGHVPSTSPALLHSLPDPLVSLLHRGTQIRHNTPDVASKVPRKENNHLPWSPGYAFESVVRLPLVHVTAVTKARRSVLRSAVLAGSTFLFGGQWFVRFPQQLAIESYRKSVFLCKSICWFEESHRHFIPCTYVMCFFLCCVSGAGYLKSATSGLSLLIGLFDLSHKVVNDSHMEESLELVWFKKKEAGEERVALL